MVEKICWTQLLSTLEIDENRALKRVGAPNFCDRWYIGNHWYQSVTRRIVLLAKIPFDLFETACETSSLVTKHLLSGNSLSSHWFRLIKFSTFYFSCTVVNRVWAACQFCQFTTNNNGPRPDSLPLYLTDKVATDYEKIGWGPFAVGYLEEKVSFNNFQGECHGQSLFFVKLFFELERVIEDPLLRAYKIASLFEKGSPIEATILQSYALSIKPRLWIVVAKMLNPLMAIFFIASYLLRYLASIKFFSLNQKGLPRGTMASATHLTRVSGEFMRWRDNILLPFLGLSQKNMRVAANRQWIASHHNIDQPVSPLPEQWQSLPVGVYLLSLRGVFLPITKETAGHTIVYIKLKQDCGLVFDPNYGLAKYTGEKHIQHIEPIYSEIMPEISLFEITKQGFFSNGPGVINSLWWVLKG